MENSMTVWGYIDSKMLSLNKEGRKVTAGNYGKASRCLRGYCQKEDLAFDDITEEFISGFNAFLVGRDIQQSTVSFYNRVLRSLYNQAAKEGLVKNAHPFDGVYTLVEVRLAPVSIVKNGHGQQVNLEDLPKDELVRQYQNLQRKYNTLVGKITSLVGV